MVKAVERLEDVSDALKTTEKLEDGIPMDNDYLAHVYGEIRSEFGKIARAKGYDVSGEIHDWNYPKHQYPERIVNPKNLTEPIDRLLHETIHDMTHDPNSVGRNKWDKQIKKENELDINTFDF